MHCPFLSTLTPTAICVPELLSKGFPKYISATIHVPPPPVKPAQPQSYEAEKISNHDNVAEVLLFMRHRLLLHLLRILRGHQHDQCREAGRLNGFRVSLGVE